MRRIPEPARRKRLLKLTCSAAAGAMLAIGSVAAQIAAPEKIEETSLARDAFATGVLTAESGALPTDLWVGADVEDLKFLLDKAPVRPSSPAIGDAMKAVLLSPTDAPTGADASLGGRKLLALTRIGMLDEVRTIASISNARANDPWVGRSLAEADLLSGNLDDACRRGGRLSSGRGASFWAKIRVLCDANAERFDAADLTLSILREQGALSELDDLVLTAASIPAPMQKAETPQSALQFAAIRSVGGEVSGARLAQGPAGIAKAIAADPNADPSIRLSALFDLLAMGLADSASIRAAFNDFSDEAAALTFDGRSDPLSDVALFAEIQGMEDPRFVRDRASKIADAIEGAGAFSRSIAAAELYSGAIDDLSGVLVSSAEAQTFALAKMATGESAAAAAWLNVALGDGLSGQPEEAALQFLERTNLLAVLDPVAGAAVAAAAGVTISPPRASAAPASAQDSADRLDLSRIVAAAIDAGATGSKGQAALAALALSSDQYAGDPVAEASMNASFRAADMGAVVRRLAFERAWAASFPEPAPVAEPGEPVLGLAPRVKPPTKN